MAVVSEEGLPTPGLWMLAALWFFMSFKAYLRIKRGNIAVSWLRLVPNLLLAECMIRRRRVLERSKLPRFSGLTRV